MKGKGGNSGGDVITENCKHDQLFKKAMENPLVRDEFFKKHLDAEVSNLIDYQTLKMEKDSFIEENLKDSYCDLLFSANFTGRKFYLYLLLENQLKPDKLMALRLFKYMLGICDRHMAENKGAKTLPLVYPMVFYTGKRKYNAERNLWALFENEELARKFWINDYQLIDVNDISDEELKKETWAGTMMLFMKHIFDRNILKIWEEIQDKIPEITAVEIGYSYIGILLRYSLTKIEERDKIAIEKLLNKKLGKSQGEECMASVAAKLYNDGKLEGVQQGMEKGIQQGMEQGMEKAAINMLRQNVAADLIRQVTGLSDERIRRLKRSL